ncbi:DNA polymerase III subunit alpha [Enteractinococcus fodinae]|uniref:DNA-directed DNA polymerase n=1 Tax=Enteractinococcus fodinae TaxID=684663 RepID=A0ABU2B198_9MICC|nr:DNA polymerase III subunit alpha [Enteractinococcus fodinae]MDR7347056.1 error-prone DNA polymerase [Enteractinococcus fodinae]
MAPGFAHLNVTTAYSAHFGVSWPEELVAVAAADGAQIMGCTDRDGLYGMAKHLKACVAHNIAPVVGVNLAVMWDPSSTADGQPLPAGRVTILAANAAQAGYGQAQNLGAGYQALVRLISLAHTQLGADQTPYIYVSQLARAAGPEAVLKVLVGPGSDVGALMVQRKYTAGRTRLRLWKRALPARALYTEIVSHLSLPSKRLSTAQAVRMLRASTDLDLPAVLTNAVRYATPDGAATADVVDAARALSSLDTLTDMQPNGQGWLKSAHDMHALAKEIVYEAGFGAAAVHQLLETTQRLAETCALDPAQDLGWGQPRVPEFDVIGIDGEPNTVLSQRARAGLAHRFRHLDPAGAPYDRVLDRLDHELKIIENLGFSSYFLTVAEVVSMIEDRQVRVSARGSGASSLVNYALRISHVDPIEHDLIFERFLSQDRSTLPDIDIDVESARRHEIYHAIFDRFGQERTTLMSMQNGYRVRGAVRDAGRALGLEREQVDHLAKKLWRFSASDFRQALEHMPELQNFAAQVQNSRKSGNQQLDLLVDLTERLDRLPRHISMHPCGVILGDATLLDRTPVEASGMGLPMSQFDKHDMDPMGMLKLDVLGVRMQSTIAYAIEEIQRTTGEHIDLETVPHDDPATYEMIKTTHTLGCFQIESPGQRELIGKLEPESITDLIIDISLFRPGPMKSDMVRPFLDYRHQLAPAHYPHPRLKPILEETHGVTVFHEQLLRTFDAMTGCGLAAADEFRRRLGSDEQPEVEAYFRAKAMERGWDIDVIDEVWETLAAFGSFGFCKAHGAAFAIPTFESAWLKTHYPAAFMAAVLEHDPGMYPQRLMVAEARRMGIEILPVDINRSTTQMRLEPLPHPHPSGHRWGIRLALTTVLGLTHKEMQRIERAQPFDSLADIRDRARLSKKSLEHLAQLGALDCLLPATGISRTDLVHHLEFLHSPTRRDRTGRSLRLGRPQIEGQQALPLGDTELETLPALFPEPTAEQRIRTELDLTAIDATGHLMQSHKPYLDALGTTPADQLLKLRNHTRVMVAGVRVATQTPPMRSGNRVVFISIDDGTGVVDTSFFAQAQHATGDILFSARLMLIEGTTRRTGTRGITLQAIRAWDMHDPASLPDPDYWDTQRSHWAQWLAKSPEQPAPPVVHQSQLRQRALAPDVDASVRYRGVHKPYATR